MARVSWERYGGDDIEAVVAMLVNRERPNSTRITPSKGDGGVDILDRGAGADGGDVVYQVKRYTEPLSSKQKSDIEGSWERLKTDRRWESLNVTEWHVVAPWDPTPEIENWLQGVVGDDHTAIWHGLAYVESLTAKYPEVVDYYLHDGRSHVEDAYQAAMALFAPSDAGNILNVPAVSARLSKALAVLEGDPHYRYESRFGEGDPPTPVIRRGLMMTWINVEEPGGRWQAVDVIARCAASPKERLITIDGTLRAKTGSRLATDLQDFVDFGTPISAPTGSFTGSIDAPAGLGGSLNQASMRMFALKHEVGEDPDLIFEVRSPTGDTVVETEVSRMERSEGSKGVRVVLAQSNNVFTLEDRYALPIGGSRRLRFGDYSHQPAHAVRDALLFITSAAPPNKVFVRRKGTPTSTASADPNWAFQYPADVVATLDGIKAPVDALAELQQHTGTIVRVPDLSATTEADVAGWRCATKLLNGERITCTYPEGQAIGVELDVEFDGLPEVLVVQVPLKVSVGEQLIDFGPMYVRIEQASLAKITQDGGRQILWLTTPDRIVRWSRNHEVSTPSADSPKYPHL